MQRLHCALGSKFSDRGARAYWAEARQQQDLPGRVNVLGRLQALLYDGARWQPRLGCVLHTLHLTHRCRIQGYGLGFRARFLRGHGQNSTSPTQPTSGDQNPIESKAAQHSTAQNKTVKCNTVNSTYLQELFPCQRHGLPKGCVLQLLALLRQPVGVEASYPGAQVRVALVQRGCVSHVLAHSVVNGIHCLPPEAHQRQPCAGVSCTATSPAAHKSAGAAPNALCS